MLSWRLDYISLLQGISQGIWHESNDPKWYFFCLGDGKYAQKKKRKKKDDEQYGASFKEWEEDKTDGPSALVPSTANKSLNLQQVSSDTVTDLPYHLPGYLDVKWLPQELSGKDDNNIGVVQGQSDR